MPGAHLSAFSPPLPAPHHGLSETQAGRPARALAVPAPGSPCGSAGGSARSPSFHRRACSRGASAGTGWCSLAPERRVQTPCLPLKIIVIDPFFQNDKINAWRRQPGRPGAAPGEEKALAIALGRLARSKAPRTCSRCSLASSYIFRASPLHVSRWPPSRHSAPSRGTAADPPGLAPRGESPGHLAGTPAPPPRCHRQCQAAPSCPARPLEPHLRTCW